MLPRMAKRGGSAPRPAMTEPEFTTLISTKNQLLLNRRALRVCTVSPGGGRSAVARGVSPLDLGTRTPRPQIPLIRRRNRGLCLRLRRMSHRKGWVGWLGEEIAPAGIRAADGAVLGTNTIVMPPSTT